MNLYTPLTSASSRFQQDERNSEGGPGGQPPLLTLEGWVQKRKVVTGGSLAYGHLQWLRQPSPPPLSPLAAEEKELWWDGLLVRFASGGWGWGGWVGGGGWVNYFSSRRVQAHSSVPQDDFHEARHVGFFGVVRSEEGVLLWGEGQNESVTNGRGCNLTEQQGSGGSGRV